MSNIDSLYKILEERTEFVNLLDRLEKVYYGSYSNTELIDEIDAIVLGYRALKEKAKG